MFIKDDGRKWTLIQVRDRWQAVMNIAGTFRFCTAWGIL
jgi:hypothetical protein